MFIWAITVIRCIQQFVFKTKARQDKVLLWYWVTQLSMYSARVQSKNLVTTVSKFLLIFILPGTLIQFNFFCQVIKSSCYSSPTCSSYLSSRTFLYLGYNEWRWEGANVALTRFWLFTAERRCLRALRAALLSWCQQELINVSLLRIIDLKIEQISLLSTLLTRSGWLQGLNQLLACYCYVGIVRLNSPLLCCDWNITCTIYCSMISLWCHVAR